MLLDGEGILAGGLRGDGNKEPSAIANLGVEIAPCFELGDTIGAPAATKEADNKRSD